MQLDVEQNTPQWLELRKRYLGASDAAICMGISPWKSVYQLWLDKTGRTSHKKSDPNASIPWQIARGNRFEPMARARYELINDIDLPATTLVHPTIPYLMASLDGFNAEQGIVLEIKIPGKETFQKAKEGLVVDHYAAQLEQQMLVAGAEVNHFYCCLVGVKNGKEQIIDDALVVYKSNPELRAKVLEATRNFWEEYVVKDIQPPLKPNEALILDHLLGEEKINECEQLVFKNEADYLALEEAEFIYQKAKEEHDRSLERLSAFKKDVASLFTHPVIKIGKVKFTEKTLKNGKKEYGVRLLKSAA